MGYADDLVMCLGDFNGHIGRVIYGFVGVHGGYGVGQRNLEGRMLFKFCLEKLLCVSNTWFKREEKRKVTFRICKKKKKLLCVDKERTPTISLKCEGNPWGVSTCLSDSRYRLEECSEKDIC